ncbi:hypothetical protein ABIB40_002908 [Pedobacter sp. UYP30]|uniref:glycosyltransferase n=1 Tax=Pedobacter sp. UYP30 TaxID=1756400 RepID=UPI0033966CA0
MKKDLTILIAWHQESDIGKIVCFEQNKRTFKMSNPGVEVITVMSHFNEPNQAWLSTDLSIFHWYALNRPVCERFVLVEWDAWCDLNLHDYFKRVWDCDVVGPCIKYPKRDEWYWFSTISQMPMEIQPYATGIVPFCGIMVSQKAMDKICEEILNPCYLGLNSELRFATVAVMLGFEPITNPVVSRSISWRNTQELVDGRKTKGIHHPRKFLEIKHSLAVILDSLPYTSSGIPKIIHQTWKEIPLPDDLELLAQTWKERHLDWAYLLWTDEMNRAFISAYFPHFLVCYDSYKSNIQRVDAVRYFIMYKIGGVFVDADFECVENIEPIIRGCEVVFAMEPDDHCKQFGMDKIICNAFMACRPGNNFMGKVCDSMRPSIVTGKNFIEEILSSTGPFALTRIYDEYTDKKEITILPSATVYPLSVNEARRAFDEDVDEHMQEKIDKAYAIHYFFGTWYSNIS